MKTRKPAEGGFLWAPGVEKDGYYKFFRLLIACEKAISLSTLYR
ncbi:Hypothetical protein (plasmid) [Pseudomonas putida]|nr:Hypothetical protein [Pseudomonas putida]